MQDQLTTLHDLKTFIQKFMQERDWVQFHSPKNLSMSLSCEAAELMEHFLWVESKDSHQVFDTKRKDIEHEVADVAILLLEFCITNNIDLTKAIHEKMKHNAEKYPVEKAKGKAIKYTEL